jgi:hypothetical protein
MGIITSGIYKSSMSHTKCGKSIIGKKFRTKVESILDLSNGLPELNIKSTDDFLFLHPIIYEEIDFIVTDLTSAQTPMGYWAYIWIKFLNDIDLDNIDIPNENYNKFCMNYITNRKLCMKEHRGIILLKPRFTKNFINIKKLSECGDYDYNFSATYDTNKIEII